MTRVHLRRPEPIAASMHGFMDQLLYEPGPPPKLDLSHGTNRLGAYSTLRHLISNALETERLTEYDSPFGNEALRCAIAEFESVTGGGLVGAHQVVVTHGAAEGLDFLFRALVARGRGRALLLDPQFPTIFRTAQAAGLEVVIGTVQGATGHAAWTAATIAVALAEAAPDVVVISEPGNPGGGFLDRDVLVGLFTWVASRDIDVVVDKACGDIGSSYWEPWPHFMGIASMTGASVHIVDSYSKRRALPGLRVGYMVTDRDAVEIVRRLTVGRTTTTVAVEALIWDLSTCTLAASKDLSSLTEDQFRHLEEIDRTHEVTVSNLAHLRRALGDHLCGGLSFASGINCEASIRLQRPIPDRELASRLHDFWEVGTYPISCFEGADGRQPTAVFRNRFTLATPPELFRDGVDRLMQAIQALDS